MNPVVMNDEEVIRLFQRSEFIMRTVLLRFLLADVVSIKNVMSNGTYDATSQRSSSHHAIKGNPKLTNDVYLELIYFFPLIFGSQ